MNQHKIILQKIEELRTAKRSLFNFECCGGNDDNPERNGRMQAHTQDCESFPGRDPLTWVLNSLEAFTVEVDRIDRCGNALGATEISTVVLQSVARKMGKA